MLIELLIYLSVGAIAGIIAGLLGAGGGAVIIPPLVWIFHVNHFSDTIIMQLAIGTAMATIVITALASIRAHQSRGGVRWELVRQLTPGIIVGALLGALLAGALASDVLQWVFGVFILLLAIQIGFGLRPSAQRDLPSLPGMFAAGSIIGVVSSLVGIGGAALTVPFLVWCNTPLRNAVGTSAACGLPIALAGSAGYILTGWHADGLPAWSLGYIYLPALLCIVAASTLFAPLGARLAHALPSAVLKKVFAGLLVLIGIRMLTA
jgi:uncharacterized membrane protein YfcA